MRIIPILIIAILMATAVTAQPMKISQETGAYELKATQYEKAAFVFTNSPKSTTLELTITGGNLLNEEGTEIEQVNIKPGETKVIQTMFTEQGTYKILHKGERVFAEVTVTKNTNVFTNFWEGLKNIA